MMKHLSLVIALPFAVSLVANSASAARYYTHSGVGCAAVAGQEGCLDRSNWGVNNNCATTVTVECPIYTSQFNIATAQYVVTNLGFQGFDRNASTDVVCDFQRIDASGNITYTKTLQTTGNSQPVQGPNFNTGGSVGLSGTWLLRCSIPALSSGNASHVLSYSMMTNE